MTIPHSLLRLLIVTVCLSLAQPFVAVAQTNAPAPLPPAAEEALGKGIIAAKVPDYLLAIRYFEEARKLAPQAPVIYLNLGIAESKIPSRELRAMAWFGAYLAAYPDAPNAAAVKEQIGVLEVSSQSNISRLMMTVQDAAIQTSDGKDENLRFVAKLWAEAGDFAAAVKVTALIHDGLFLRRAQRDIARAHADTGMLTQNEDMLITLLSECSDCRNIIAKAQDQTKVRITNVSTIKVFDWLFLLKGGCRSSVDMACEDKGRLNTDPFLGLAGYLKSLPRSDNSQTVFASIYGAAKDIVGAHNVIIGMLKQQAKQ